MEIVVAISSFLVILGILILVLTQREKERYLNLRVCTWVIGIAFAFFGIFLLPFLVKTHEKVIEIQNYNIIKSKNAIVVDLTNSKLITSFSYINELKKFDTYDAVTNFSDSTKFYIVYEKSFYNVTGNKYIAWSNPPYTNLKIE